MNVAPGVHSTTSLLKHKLCSRSGFYFKTIEIRVLTKKKINILKLEKVKKKKQL